jgi:predicted RNA-binding protein with RPS1 domain
MEKDLGKINKNEETDIVVRLDDFGGKVGLTIREFITSERYTGFTKKGTRIPAEKIAEFKDMVSSIDEEEIEKMQQEAESNEKKPGEKTQPKDQKTL